MAAKYFYPLLHAVLLEAATVQPDLSKQRYAYKGKCDN
jgi:hypothetical protein